MPEISKEIKTPRKNIYDDLRAINSMDLTRNEAKVLICYRVEMDEVTRQVRGKSQATFLEATGLCRSQFSDASGSLQRRGIITAVRVRNAPQIITVHQFEGSNHKAQEVRETRMSGKPVIRDSGRPENPDSGRPENPDREIYTAPVSSQESAPKCAGEGAKPRQSNVIAVTDWRKGIPGPEPEPEPVTVAADGTIALHGDLLAKWLSRFGSQDRLALALETVRIQPNSNEPAWKQVSRQLAYRAADKADRDGRYQAAKQASTAADTGLTYEGKPYKLTTTVRYAKPAEEVANA